MTSTTTIFDTAPTGQSAAWAFAGPALGCVFGAIITYHPTEYDPVRDLAARATALRRAWLMLPLITRTDASDTQRTPLLVQYTRDGVMHPVAVFAHPNNLNDFKIRRDSARISA
jgi:hypothetical protein